jgi:hypothetical protein
MNRAGMTLLEVLLAATLLAAVAVAIGTWTRITARASVQITELHAREREASAAVRLLRADVAGSIGIGWELDAAGRRLEVRTTHRLPGQVPDVRVISWTCATDGITRSETASVPAGVAVPAGPGRHFTLPLVDGRFERTADGLLWLKGGIPNEATAATPSAAILVCGSWSR